MSVRQAVTIFVISLAAAPLRRRRICEHLASLGLVYDLLDAVDGRLLAPEQLSSLDLSGSPPGLVGCYLSHINAYRSIVERRLPVALILEDDARLNKTIAPLLEFGIKSTHFDYLFLDCAAHNDDGPVFFDRAKPTDLGFGFTSFPLSAGPQGTHALMITFDAAKRRLASALPMLCSIDVYSHLRGEFRFSAVLGPRGAHLAEDSLVSFTSARDMRASRPRFATLRRLPLLTTLRDTMNPRYRRSARLVRQMVNDGTLPSDGSWRPLPDGRRILEVNGAPLDDR